MLDLKKRKWAFIAPLMSIILVSWMNPEEATASAPVGGYDSIRTITTAVPFLSIGPDARSGALGEAGVALSADANSIYWNTAKLAFAEDRASFATSFTPWLRSVVNDMSISQVSGFQRTGDRGVLTLALTYFDLGDITFTDQNGGELGTFSPKEYVLNTGYALQLSNKLGVGLNTKFINSNLSGNAVLTDGTKTRPGRTLASDLSVFYTTDKIVSGKPAKLNLAATVSNIGTKIKYTNSVNDNKDFLPANLKIGGVLETELDPYQSLLITVDANKLLVPSPAIYDYSNLDAQGQPALVLGRNSDDVSVSQGIFGSFTDAPGIPVEDEQGNITAEKGSRLKEELREINLSVGAGYTYRDILAFRAGYFHENPLKGNREYLTFGFGVKYQFMNIDVAYLSSLRQNSPLANTLRFTIHFNINKSEESEAPELIPEGV